MRKNRKGRNYRQRVKRIQKATARCQREDAVVDIIRRDRDRGLETEP
jgi:hypothetical protein